MIRRKVSHIDLAFNQAGMQRNDTTIAVVRFVNGTLKVLVFLANGVLVAGEYKDPSSGATLKGGEGRTRPS